MTRRVVCSLRRRRLNQCWSGAAVACCSTTARHLCGRCTTRSQRWMHCFDALDTQYVRMSMHCCKKAHRSSCLCVASSKNKKSATKIDPTAAGHALRPIRRRQSNQELRWINRRQSSNHANGPGTAAARSARQREGAAMGARGRGRSQSGGRRWYDAAFFRGKQRPRQMHSYPCG